MKLHLGCGRNIIEGWVNVDNVPGPGIIRYNLDGAAQKPMPWRDNSVDVVYASHLIEHIRNPLPMMEELWRVCEPGAVAIFECPYGSSDDAFEDPTHVRIMFPGSFLYFGQPYYWRADYGYRGDWKVVACELEVPGALLQSIGEQGMIQRITHGRNVVLQMRVALECVKPRREQDADLREPLAVTLVPVRADGLGSNETIDRLAGPHLAPHQESTQTDASGDYAEDGGSDSGVEAEADSQSHNGSGEGADSADDPSGL